MRTPSPRGEMPLHLAADPDAGSVTKAHRQVLAALEAAEGSGAAAVPRADDVSPLSPQPIVGAGRTFRQDRLAFGARASAALAPLGQFKEI